MLKSPFYYYDEKTNQHMHRPINPSDPGQHMHRPINPSDPGQHMYPMVRAWQEACIKSHLDQSGAPVVIKRLYDEKRSEGSTVLASPICF